jgi:hypothetical protein
MNRPESIFVKCNCCCSSIEFEFDEESKEFYVSVWVRHPGIKPLSKKERIRWCEHVMKTGNPWADHTIVTKKDAQRITKFITKYLKLKKPKMVKDILLN